MKFLSQINVNTEYTLPIVDGNNGQVLTTDGNGAVYWGNVSAGVTNLDGLTDVILTSPSSGQLLRYGIPPGSGEANPVWYNFTPNYLTPSSSIDALSDVTISTATTGQILQWSGSQWVNATLSTVEYVSKVQHLVKCGVAVTKGQAVYVTSADGTNMIVGLASNASEATSSKVIGLAVSTGAINDQIFVVTEGLIAGLNTSTATAGDPVWLGTGGNLIFGLANKPVAPAHLVYLGVVTRVQSNNGEIFVNVQNGFELNELHDVLISSPSAGQLIRRDSDGLWKNWTPNYLTSLPTHNHDDRYYTESEIVAFFGGETPIAGYNQTNWDTAYNDKINSASFSTSTGVLTLTQQDSGTITVDLDGRYLESLPSHNHDDRYYTETESDSRFVNASGDTMSGSLSFDQAAVIKKRITQNGFNPVKTSSGVLTSISDNSSGYTYYVIETNVPQDDYQMGGFTIELFGRYGETNNKTKIDLAGYWNPESNSGFQGFEAHGTNPQYKPTIEVCRNSSGKTAFIIYGVSWSYPVIVARDLWLGYNSTDGGTYGEGWTITGTNDVSSYTNKDTVVWRNAYSDSNPAGYITGYTETDTLQTVTTRGASTNLAISANGVTSPNFTSTALMIINADSSGSLQPDQGSPANKILSFRWQGLEGGYIDTNNVITFTGFKTPTGTASQFLKANGTVDSSTYLTTTTAAATYATFGYVDDEITAVNTYVQDYFVPKTRTLTINGTSYDLSANRSWTIATTDSTKVSKSGESHDTVEPNNLGAGDGGFYTVKSGFGPSGGNDALIHIPYSNSDWAHQLAFDWALGNNQDMWFRTKNGGTWQGWRKVWHDGNFTDNSTNWNTAYNDRITAAAVTGTSTKTLTLTQGDGGTVTATWTDYDTDNDAQTISYSSGTNELSISNGNSITLDGLATEDYVLSQGFTTFQPWNSGTGSINYTAGNVGIGTASPNYKLDITGGSVRLTQDYSQVILNGITLRGYSADNLWVIGNSTRASINLGTSWDWDTQVAIAYTPNTPGAGQGGLAIGQTTKNSSTWTHGSTSFYTLGTERVTIDSSGNVGIGTTGPSEKLHVVGAAIFDGGAGDSSTDSVLYVTKSNSNDWGLYVNASGVDYGMYVRISPSAGYAFGIHNGTTWTTRITGDGRIHLNNKDTIASYDSWLRLNQSGEYTSGVYTPAGLRNDGTFENYGGIYGYNTIRGRKAQTNNNYTTAALWTESYDNTTTGIAFHISGNAGKFLEMRTDGVLYWENAKVWTAGNDGAASGLDADLLDGQHGSYYQPASTAITTSNIGSQSVTYATNSTRLYASDSPYRYGDQYPYSMDMRYDGTHWNLSVTPGTPSSVRVAYSDSSAYASSAGNADTLDGYDYSNFIGKNGNTYFQLSTWLQSTGSHGFYSPSSGAGTHFYPAVTSYGSFRIEGGANSFLGIELFTLTRKPTWMWDNNGGGMYSQSDSVWYYYYSHSSGRLHIGASSGNAVWHSGDFTSTNISNWNAAYNDRITAVAVSGTGTKTLTLTQQDGGTLTATWTDYDTDNDAQTLSWDQGQTLLSISGGNDVTLTGLATEDYVNSQGFVTSSGTVAGVVRTVTGTNSAELVRGNMGDNDQARILVGATASNAGYLEIATADDGTEPIYVRQYTGTFTTEARTATLLDGSGNTTFPGSLTIGGTFTENSSIRFKENIQPLEPALAKVEQLNPVTYTKITSQEEEIGLIAEEVAELFPEVVTYNEAGQPQGIQYQRLSVILLKAVQELTERVNKLENK